MGPRARLMLLLVLYLGLGLLGAPLVVLAVLVHPRAGPHRSERLGIGEIEVEPGAVWFHAASLGERRVVDAMLPALREHHPALQVLLTCTARAARACPSGADQVALLPVDVLPSVLLFLDRVRPRALILVEAELWPALLTGCRMRGVPVVRLCPRQGPGMRRLRALPGVEAALLRGVGVVESVADLKSLAPRPPPAVRWAGTALVGGSTRPGEERALVAAWEQLRPRPLLVLAPRDAARGAVVAGACAARGHTTVLRSTTGRDLPGGTEVLVLDTLGELAGLYAQAQVAFVGGTLCADVGGHSPAEAASAGCVLVRGPHIHANEPAWAGLPAEVAGDEAGLAAALVAAFSRPGRGGPVPGSVAPVLQSLAPVLAAPTPEERPLRPWLWPLAWVWLAAVQLRPAPLRRPALPTVSVGGLTAGGSGKTPVAAWIAERLPGAVVVARGYGRRAGGDVRRGGGAAELGDELEMLARRGLAVVSGPDRLAGIAAAARDGANVAVLDDGFSARGVGRDIELVVLDARWPDGGGPIPVGTRRVRRAWLAKADVVWCNHGPAPAWARAAARPDTTWVEARTVPIAWLHRGVRKPLDALPERPCIAMAGIARPAGFFRALRTLGVRPRECRTFPDHHAFGWRDLQAIEAWKDDHVVVVTEKDAARLPPGLGVWALCMEVQVVHGEAELRARFARAGLVLGGAR